MHGNNRAGWLAGVSREEKVDSLGGTQFQENSAVFRLSFDSPRLSYSEKMAKEKKFKQYPCVITV